jgi:hypothetical protein
MCSNIRKEAIVAERLVHCWKQGPLLWVGDGEFVSSTCMLRDRHPGPCDFVRDDEIQIGCTDPDCENDSSLYPAARAAAVREGGERD